MDIEKFNRINLLKKEVEGFRQQCKGSESKKSRFIQTFIYSNIQQKL